MFIYLTHVIVGSGVRILLQRFAHVEAYAVHLVVGMAAGLVVPWIIFEIYGSVPWVQGLWKWPGSRS